MTAFKTIPASPKRLRQLCACAFVLLSSSALFACSQPSSSGNDASTITPELQKQTAIQTASADTAQQNGLKNVSATVYKDINCGCCKDWIEHADSHGLSATAEHPSDLAAVKERLGVPAAMRSCHTAVTASGYIFEGHVPAKYMTEFLRNPPKQALGLAVPGMPVGSPGMEYQDEFMPYQIMQINKDGTTQVYADIEASAQQL